MVSQLLKSPDYQAVHEAIAQATYWARLGDFVNTPGHANRIVFDGGFLRLEFGANYLNLSHALRGIKWRLDEISKIGLTAQDLVRKVKGESVLKGNLLNQLATTGSVVENAKREQYSSYPITDDYFVFGATYVHVPTLCRCLLRHLGYPELAEDRYWV